MFNLSLILIHFPLFNTGRKSGAAVCAKPNGFHNGNVPAADRTDGPVVSKAASFGDKSDGCFEFVKSITDRSYAHLDLGVEKAEEAKKLTEAGRKRAIRVDGGGERKRGRPADPRNKRQPLAHVNNDDTCARADFNDQ